MALALTIKKVCQRTRGVEMNEQTFYHEYWYFSAKSLLDEVRAKYSDFPIVQLTWAAQVKSDWEGYLWHWALRKMLEQENYAGLEDVGTHVAKARTALATLRAIVRHGLLMHDPDQTRLGRTIWPTMKHVAHCVQFCFGNPAFDPATIKRDEHKRSRLMVELFDNYLKWGHNWYWERSRNWAYLARVSNNLPPYKCDSCGKTMTRDHQMWRCPRCGKSARPAIPGTWEVVEPFRCLKCGYRDDYRLQGMACPACGARPDGRYAIRWSHNAPTFERQRQGLKNVGTKEPAAAPQAPNPFTVHEILAKVFTPDNYIATQADHEAYKAWLATSPKAELVPENHRMELEAHEMRLRNELAPR